MSRYQNQRARQTAAAAEPAAKAPNMTEYQAPIVGLEDKNFTIGSTADAVLLIVKILSSNPTIGAWYSVILGAFAAGSAAAAGRLAH